MDPFCLVQTREFFVYYFVFNSLIHSFIISAIQIKADLEFTIDKSTVDTWEWEYRIRADFASNNNIRARDKRPVPKIAHFI